MVGATFFAKVIGMILSRLWGVLLIRLDEIKLLVNGIGIDFSALQPDSLELTLSSHLLFDCLSPSVYERVASKRIVVLTPLPPHFQVQ